MGSIGGPELLIVLVVVLLVFGPRKIPEIARGLGRGIREFQRLSTEFQRELNLADALEEKEKGKGKPAEPKKKEQAALPVEHERPQPAEPGPAEDASAGSAAAPPDAASPDPDDSSPSPPAAGPPAG
jgi:sec-independent protein translocase protein TatB